MYSRKNNIGLNIDHYDVPKEWLKRNILQIFPSIRKGKNVGFDIFDFNMLFNDEQTKALIRTGETIGCFYIESPGMRALLKKLQVETFEMLTAASSIIRPGVAESGMMQEFIARHKDPKRRVYLVPQMEKHLQETYGVMVYQEDVIKIAHHIAGLTLEEADLLRRAMSGKMRSHQAMVKIQNKFFDSCIEKGLTKKESEELWRQIESFAGYSFCKAHSASFALLSYQVAFLKTHYTAEFMACVLNNGGGFYAPGVYVWEAKRRGVKMLLPCINQSEYEYVGENNVIRIGLMAIKQISSNTIDRILDERAKNGEYQSLLDFILRTRTGYEETTMLIKCGAMGCFKQTRITLLRLLDLYMKKRKVLDDSSDDLFEHESFVLEEKIKTDENFSAAEICKAEYEAFDYMVTRHPLFFFKEHFREQGVITASQMKNNQGKRVKMIGWYISSKRIRTRKGEIMKFLSLEDTTGTFEAVLFPRVYNEYVDKTLSMGPYLIEGRVDENDFTNLVTEKVELLASIDVKEKFFKDSVDHNYYGDIEKVNADEFYIVEKLGEEKMLKAYVA